MKAMNLAVSLSSAAVAYLIFVGLNYGLLNYATMMTDNPWLMPLGLLVGVVGMIAGMLLAIFAVTILFIK